MSTFRLLLLIDWQWRMSFRILTPSSKEMTSSPAVATDIPNSFCVGRRILRRNIARLISVEKEFSKIKFEMLSAEMSTFDDDEEEDVP